MKYLFVIMSCKAMPRKCGSICNPKKAKAQGVATG